VFGAIRAPYSSPARFFADEAPRSNRIIWYPAQPGAIWYTEPTIFVPRVEFSDQPPPNEYERTGWIKKARHHYRITDRWHFLGDHWHGDEDDFLGRSTSDKYIVGTNQLESCGPHLVELFADWHLGEKSLPPVEKLPAAFHLNVINPPVPLKLPAAANITIAAVRPNLVKLPAKYALTTKDAPIVTKLPMKWALTIRDAMPGRLPAAFALATKDIYPAVQLLKLPAAVNITVADPVEVVETVKLPAEYALTIANPIAGLVKLPAEFALTIADVAGGPTPGASCSSAGTIALDTDYTFTVGSGASQWFVMSITEFGTYHVNLTQNTGTIGSLAVMFGRDCRHLREVFSLGAVSCNSDSGNHAETKLFIKAQGSFFGPCNYTFRVGAGGC